jgi:hypothetical protein
MFFDLDASSYSSLFDSLSSSLSLSVPGILDVNYDEFGNFIGEHYGSDGFESGFPGLEGLNSLNAGAAAVVMLNFLANPGQHSMDEWEELLRAAVNSPGATLDDVVWDVDSDGNFIWGGTLNYQ